MVAISGISNNIVPCSSANQVNTAVVLSSLQALGGRGGGGYVLLLSTLVCCQPTELIEGFPPLINLLRFTPTSPTQSMSPLCTIPSTTRSLSSPKTQLSSHQQLSPSFWALLRFAVFIKGKKKGGKKSIIKNKK